jgi:Tol biopolymer transport system component
MPHQCIRSVFAGLAVFALGLPAAFAQSTERVSVDSSGIQGNHDSAQTAISSDGRFVVFDSRSSNLVPGDTNGVDDIFVHDRQTGQTTRVSVDSGGLQGNDYTDLPCISSDGRFVAFESHASNLVVGDTNARGDVFVHDRQTGVTTRVSMESRGLQGNDNSGGPSISSDGRFVAFMSFATNLVPGDTNAAPDIFVHDRQTGQTTRVSVDSGGLEGNGSASEPCISSTGRFVVFESIASNLVPGDTNNYRDIFAHDRQTGQTTRVSVDSGGFQCHGESFRPSISWDGRFIAFVSEASDLVPGDTNNHRDIIVHNRLTSQTTRVSVDSGGHQSDGGSWKPRISSDGRYVAFASFASNLVPGDTNGVADVFAHDRLTGQMTLVSVDTGGFQGNDASGESSISSDGRFVAYESRASNLVPGDTNGRMDVFVHDRGSQGASLVNTGTCPGAVRLTVTGATANGAVAIIHGTAGVFVKPTPPCQGVTLGIASPTLAAMRTASAVGKAELHFYAPPGACGHTVQAVDVTTCTATNTITL